MVKSFFSRIVPCLQRACWAKVVDGILAELSPGQNQKLSQCLFHVTEVGFFIICPSRVPWMPWDDTSSFMKA